MELKTVTWNIGGGKLLRDGEDPTKMASYTVDGIERIANWLKTSNPDIITIQEAHGDENGNQIERIAKYLSYGHFFFDPTSDSHIDPTQKLGNGLISKYPISNLQTGRFLNPNIIFELEGKSVATHDKGYGSCDIQIGDITIRATTLHLIPFRSVGLEFDSEEAGNILASVSSELCEGIVCDFELIQGDFNINSSTVGIYLDELFASNKLNEIVLEVPTTPNARMYDHVLYKGLKLVGKASVDSEVKTDHYPIECSFVAE